MTSSVKDVCESWVTSPSLEVILGEATYLLDNDSSPTVACFVIDSLLGALSLHCNPEPSELIVVASLIRKIGSSVPSIGSILLSHLSLLPDATPFLDVIPHLFGVSPPSSLEIVYEQLQALALAENRYLLPVVSALIDLPLPASVKPALARLADEAIGVVDENDIPFLFRTILKNLSDIDAYSITFRLRKEMASLTHTTISLAVESLWDTLLTCPYAADCFLLHIKREFSGPAAQKLQPSLVDVAIVLILYSESLNDIGGQCSPIILNWLENGVFPFMHLSAIIQLKGSNEAWARLVPAVWEIARDLLILSVRSAYSVNSGPADGGGPNDLDSCVRQLFSDLYSHCIECREGIIRLLLDNIYATQTNRTVSGRGDLKYSSSTSLSSSVLIRSGHHTGDGELDMAISQTMPSVKELLGYKQSQGVRLRDKFVSLQQLHTTRDGPQAFSGSRTKQLALQSAVIMESIIRDHSEVISTVMSSLVERIQAPMSGVVLREQKGSMALELPCPVVLYHVLLTIVNSISSQPTVENNLLIMTQKLVGGFSVPDGAIAGVFCGVGDGMQRQQFISRGPDENAGRTGILTAGCGHEFAFLGSPSCDYPPGAVGMMVAGAMMTRLLQQSADRSSSSFMIQDMTAIFGWVQRTITSGRDIGVAYALDVLTLLARSIVEGKGRADALLPALQSGFNAFMQTYTSLLSESADNDDTDYTIKFPLSHPSSSNGDSLNSSDSGSGEVALVFRVGGIATRIEHHFCTSGSSSDMIHAMSPHALSVFATAAFWIVQRVALLHGCITSVLLRRAGATQMMIGVALSPPLEKTCNMRRWVWRCCDEYMTLKTRHLDKNSSRDMRLAWELSLLAAVLHGYLSAGYSSGKNDTTLLSDVLILVSSARYYISSSLQSLNTASTAVGGGILNHGGASGGSAGKTRASRMVGMKRKGSPAVINSPKSPRECNNADENKKMNVKIQCFFLRRNLNRMIHQIPVEYFRTALNLQEILHNPERIKALISTREMACDGEPIHHVLFTEIGLHYVMSMCGCMFMDGSNPVLDDPFVLIDDLPICGRSNCAAPPLHSSSSSAINSQVTSPDEQTTDVGRNITYKAVCELFSLLPVIVARVNVERYEYHQQGETVSDTPTKNKAADCKDDSAVKSTCEGNIDYPGYCLLLSALYMSLTQYISFVEKSAVVDKVEALATDQNLSNLTHALLTAVAAVDELKYHNTDANSFMAGPVLTPQLSSAERLCTLYSHVERHVLSTPNAVVALFGAQFAIMLSRGTLLFHRAAAVMWFLSKTMHEYDAESILPLASGGGEYAGPSVGSACGLLSSHFQACMLSILKYLRLDASADLLLDGTDIDVKIVKGCSALVQSAYASCLRPLTTQDALLLSEQEQFTTFRLFWCMWWHEEGHTADGRIYGTCLLIMEALSLMRASVLTSTPSKVPKRMNTRKSTKNAPASAPTNIQPVDTDSDNHYAKTSEKAFARHKRSECSIRRISTYNAEKYFSFALSYLPLLLLQAKPIDPSGDVACKEDYWGGKFALYTAMGPYRPVVHILQLMSLSVMEFSHLLSSSTHDFRCNLSLIGHVIKTCRIFLSVIDVALQKAILWRSASFSSSPDDLNSTTPDWTSAEYLKPLFVSALVCINETCNLSDVVSKELMSARMKISVPKNLSRSAPQVKVHADRARTKLARTALTHSLNGFVRQETVEDCLNCFNSLDWIEMMQTKAIFYDSICADSLSDNPSTSAWTEVEVVQILSSQKELRDATLFVSTDIHTSQDEGSGKNIGDFFVQSVGRSGWGGDSVDGEDEESNASDNEDYDITNNDDEEEEEEEDEAEEGDEGWDGEEDCDYIIEGTNAFR